MPTMSMISPANVEEERCSILSKCLRNIAYPNFRPLTYSTISPVLFTGSASTMPLLRCQICNQVLGTQKHAWLTCVDQHVWLPNGYAANQHLLARAATDSAVTMDSMALQWCSSGYRTRQNAAQHNRTMALSISMGLYMSRQLLAEHPHMP